MTLGNNPQPLTRRQLRELAKAQEPATAAADDAEPRDSTDAGAEAPAPEPAPDTDTVAVAPAAAEPPRTEAPAPLLVAQVPGSPAAETGHTLTRRELRALQAAATAIDPATDEVADSAPVPIKAPVLEPAASAPAPGVLNPPLGHWSVDRDDDSHIQAIGRRDDESFDDLVGRDVGSGGIPTTTNALILPAIPRQGPAGPITSTGEIMITGSIDLPRSLGATGQHPNLFDSSEMDRMLDQLDEGGHHNDVAPVSASRAVSTHTSTRGVMTPPRKRGASLPTVLAITAAVLAIGVLALFVVGYAFNIY